jgi:hypothetical protein
MAKQRSVGFVVAVDPSIKLSNTTKAQVTGAIGAAAASELARLDLGGRVAFIPHVKWPGGRIIDLVKVLTPDQIKQIDSDVVPVLGGA